MTFQFGPVALNYIWFAAPRVQLSRHLLREDRATGAVTRRTVTWVSLIPDCWRHAPYECR